MRTTAVLTVALGLAFPAIAKAHFLPHRKHLTLAERVSYFERSIRHDRADVHRDQRLLRKLVDARWLEVTGARPLYRLISHRARFHRVAFRWHRALLKHYNAKLQARALPAHYSAWMCIHSHEGSWTDSGAPFWGGLQMDYGFQSTYGGELLARKGTADHWTPLEQMTVAERAYNSGRGFYPWPNTARYCGLI